MPLPLIPILIAVGTSAVAIGKSVKAAVDKNTANKTNKKANEIVNQAKNRINVAREKSGSSIKALGRKKLDVSSYSINRFVNTFGKLKNVDFRQSVGLNELSKFQIDSQSLSELKELGSFATSIINGLGGGALGGALTAFGAYSAAGTFAAASTGTAIASLNGVAATNATLAFFGGGSLATGGAGIAGGTMVLGGLVAGPALAIMGLIVGSKASKAKDEAYSNLAQARKYSEEMDAAVDLCRAIAKRADMFRELLSKLERYFDMSIKQMQEAIVEHGNDFRSFSQQQKESVAASASLAKAIKSVIDTPILTKDGNLTSQSENILKEMNSVSIMQKGVALMNVLNAKNTSQSTNNSTIPDIENIVKKYCYQYCYNNICCKVRWSELINSLNSNYHLDLTPKEYSAIIHQFGKSLVIFDSLISECLMVVCFGQVSKIVESCFRRQNVNPMHLTEHDIDISILIHKLHKTYGISLEAWQLLNKGVSTTFPMKKIVDSIITKITGDRMILSQNKLRSIISEKAIESDKKQHYNYNKPATGKDITKSTRMNEVRARCNHFNEWVKTD